MRVLLSLFLFATLVFADISITGRFLGTNNPTFFYPTSDPCTPSTTSYAYRSFNNTFSTAGVRVIQVIGYPYVYIYRGTFDPSKPCLNSQSISLSSRYASGLNDNSHALNTAFGYYFEADTYIIVLAISSSDTSSFGVNIIDSVSTQKIALFTSSTTSPGIWRQPYTSSSGVSTGNNVTYSSYVFTAPTTGRYDIGAFLANSTAASSLEVSLGFYYGTVTDDQIYNNLSAGLFPYENADEQGVWIYYLPLTAGQTYTIVASNYYGGNDPSYVGFFATPTVASRFNSGSSITGVFTEPYSYSSSSSCTTRGDGYTGLPYVVKTFTAQGSIVLTVSSDSSDYNSYLPIDILLKGADFYSYMYRGNNSNPPTACPITSTYVGSADSGIVSDNAAAGATHTSVVSFYGSNSNTFNLTELGLVLYIFAGPTIGDTTPTPAPTPAPTPTTTGSTTTNPTTTGSTTTTTKTSTSTTSKTSDATHVIASLLFALFVLLGLLF